MLKNYLLLTLRSINKNRLYAFLNTFGLALGIAAAVFIYQYVTYQQSFDRFHHQPENLYRLQYQIYQEGKLSVNSAMAVPRIGPFMKEKLPEVTDYARAYPLFGVMENDQHQFRESRVFMADPSILRLFNFPLIHGNPDELLNAPNQIVITKEMALKYFGKTDVIGETLSFHPWLYYKTSITGVVDDLPKNTHFPFDFLVSYETLNQQSKNSDGTFESERSWDWYTFYSYVRLAEGSDATVVKAKLDQLLEQERGAYTTAGGQQDRFLLQPVTHIHLHSKLEQEIDTANMGDDRLVFFLSLIGVAILIIAWVNYINLATARSVERAKEVGIRKTMGAHRGQLIGQFFTEAFVMNLAAFMVGALLVLAGRPYLASFTEMEFGMETLTNDYFMGFAILFFIISTIVSGLYPAFVLSAFKPTQVLKGRAMGKQGGNLLRKSLVVFQFVASMALIACTMIVFQQLAHLKEAKLAFSPNQKLVLKGPMIYDDEQYISTLRSFRNEVLKIPEISSFTASSNVPGDEIIWTNEFKRHNETDDQLKPVSFVGVDHDYFDTYGVEMVAGRNFDRTFTTDTGAVILNESALWLLGYAEAQEAIGQQITMYDDPKTIVGVVTNYKLMSAKAVVPAIVFPLSTDMNRYFTFKIQTDNHARVLSAVKTQYERFFPGNPYDHFVLEGFFKRLYANEEKVSSVFTIFTMLAIMIACLGLFGLSSFNMLQRAKEIGIRKTLGASIESLLVLLSKEYLLLILVANVIAWPVIYGMMNSWLENYASRINIGITTLLTAGIILLAISLLTIGYKTVRTALANPVEALRDE